MLDEIAKWNCVVPISNESGELYRNIGVIELKKIMEVNTKTNSRGNKTAL
jgi:hypothetical protein